VLACCRLPGGVRGTGSGSRRGAAPTGDALDWSGAAERPWVEEVPCGLALLSLRPKAD